MPQISRFAGITVEMYYRDHPPPPFHVYSSDESAIIDINTMHVTHGRLSPRIQRLVIQWGLRHRGLLRQNWRRAMESGPLLWIDE